MLGIIILAIIAAAVLYQLYAVFGRRVGRQPEELSGPADAARREGEPAPPPRDLPDGPAKSGLATLRARDSSFDVGHFLGGARKAYEMIVQAYAAGDREALRPLVSPEVFKGFEAGIAAREAREETETLELLHPPRADLEDVDVTGDIARIRVRFLAEHRSRTRNADGDAVDDRRTAELWTFERKLTSADPNWVLARVDAAPED